MDTKEFRFQTSVAEKAREENRSRNVYLPAVILLIVAVVMAVRYLSLGVSSGAWQAYAGLAAMSFGIVLFIPVVILARRGKGSQAGMLLVGIVWITIFSLTLFFEGAFPLLRGLLGLVVSLAIVVRTLPPRWINPAVMVSVAGMIIASFFDIYAIFPKNPENTGGLISIAVIAVFSIYLLWQFRALPLVSKFIVVFLMVTLLVAGVLAVFILTTTEQALTDSVGSGLKSLADSQAQAIGDLLNQQVEAVIALSLSRTIQDEVRNFNEAYTGDTDAILAEIEELDQRWRAASAQGYSQDPLIIARLENVVAEELQKYRDAFPNNVELMVTDRYGALVGASNVTSDYYQGDEEWWQIAYSAGLGGVYVGDPEYDESAGVTAINIAVPVYGHLTGDIIGVARTTYVLEQIERLLAGTRLGETGEADIIFPGEPYQRIHEGEMEPVRAEMVNLVYSIRDQTYVSVDDYEGTPNLVSQSLVRTVADNPAVNNLGWTIIAHQDTDEALQPVAEQTQTTLLLAVVIVGLVSGGAILLAQFLARPITRLTVAAEQVSEGDLAARATVTSQDEVGRLAATFNAMTDRLRQTLEGLEQRVGERTRELTLSGEVSRALSQERDLDRLLKNAVELIQANFDLYYTQIYLVDPASAALILRSGTGSVGEELLSRAHSLPIGPGSINGLAAAERRPVIVADTETSAIFRPNPLLPETRSEMAMPLLLGERVVGVLDMQSQRPGALSEEVLPAFEALAGQLAIAIENASLFDQSQQAQAEMERQARRLTRTGWGEFLNAIERGERIGFIYDQAEVKPAEGALDVQGDGVLVTPIQVVGETVGDIHLERDAAQGWTPDESELVSAVAGQVARQVENLRLLAQAERYRSQAEEAARRLTREGWEAYLEEIGGREVGFVYDRLEVKPLDEEAVESGEKAFAQPLMVRDETIGELSVGGERPLSEEQQALINTVAERLSAHLENLRLAAQTQVALARTDELYGISSSLNEASDEDELLQVLSRPAIEAGASRANLIYLDMDERGAPEWAEIVTDWSPEGMRSVQVGTRFYLPEMPFTRLWIADPDEPLLVSDANTDERVDEYTRAAMAQGGSRAMAVIPLTRAGLRVGLITFTWDRPHEFSQQEAETYRALIDLGAPAVQNRRLFVQTQARARHEQALRQVTQRVRGSTDPDTVLRTAVRELGTVLGRNVLIRLGSAPEGDLESAAVENGKKRKTDESKSQV